MKLVRDKIPEVIYFNGEMACVHIADENEYCRLLREKLREEVDEYLESGAAEELADILEVLYSLAEFLGVSESGLERLRLDKADARGRFLRRIVWHGSRPRPELTSRAVATHPVGPQDPPHTSSAQAIPNMSLFDVSAVIRPIARVGDVGLRRKRSRVQLENSGTQLQLYLEIPSR